jgi:Leucine-rich repeat (LRR) protein
MSDGRFAQMIQERIKRWEQGGGDYLQLDLSHLGLTTLPLELIPSGVRKLTCASNKLRTLPDLRNQRTLIALDCSDNYLTNAIFEQLPISLVSLRCNYNKITKLPSSHSYFLSDTGAFRPFRPCRLEELEIFGNPIDSINDTLPPLKIFKCALSLVSHLRTHETPADIHCYCFYGTQYDVDKINSLLSEISEERIIKRTREIKEELVSVAWSPKRVDAWLAAGVEIDDM